MTLHVPREKPLGKQRIFSQHFQYSFILINFSTINLTYRKKKAKAPFPPPPTNAYIAQENMSDEPQWDPTSDKDES